MPRYSDESAFTAKDSPVTGFSCEMISSRKKTQKPTRWTEKVLESFVSPPISTFTFFCGLRARLVPARPLRSVVRLLSCGMPYPVDPRTQYFDMSLGL